MKLPNNPYMSLMCTEPFCAVCNSRVEYGTKKYKFGRMIIQAAGEFQIPCQAWVEKYAVIVLDDYIWDIHLRVREPLIQEDIQLCMWVPDITETKELLWYL